MQKQEQDIDLFFDSIKSKETRIKYSSYLKKYLEITGIDNLLSEKDPRLIERQIIDFIVKLKKEGKNWGAIHNYVCMILAFYKINDVVLNTTKITKFMPEQRKVKKDRGYTQEEISRMLEFADERTRVIILLLACTGMRIGALPSIRLGDLDNNKITVYANAKEEYFTFITPECKNAIDSYVDMRSRYGEEIDDNSFLIREQFDIRDKFAIVKCKAVGREVLQWKLRDIARRCNVRSKQVPIAHGFRKFFTTQLVISKVNPEMREMLLGHKIGLASAYYRPSEEEMYQEYQKSLSKLTINEEYRLTIENEKLQVKNDEAEYIIKRKLQEKDELIHYLKNKYEEDIPMLKQAVFDMQNLLKHPKGTIELTANQTV